MVFRYLGVLVIGMFVGFLGGLFGKGGSAVATPLLSLIGLPGFIAVASPLPATVPGTLVAAFKYWRTGLMDRPVVIAGVLVGLPATVAGSILTEYTGEAILLAVTGLLVCGFGLSFIVSPTEARAKPAADRSAPAGRPPYWRIRLVAVALVIGVTSGLLANSGGFLLAPAFSRILRLPVKKAFACSLAVSVFLALPGTIVHASLGHIDWIVTAVLALGAVPFSYLGAKTAIRTKTIRLERWYGFALAALGLFFLIAG